MTDLDLAILAADAYSDAPAGCILDWQDVRAVLTDRPDGTLVIALRGTRPPSMQDWLRDFEAWPEQSTTHPQIGRCHGGFLKGACGLLPLVLPHVAGRLVVLTGHSLGGALAVILTGLLTAIGSPPELLVTWEAPRAAGPVLAALIAGVPVSQYRYGNDPVPEVPWAPGIYMHMREPLVKIGTPRLAPIECHDIARIVTWMRAAERQALPAG